MLFKVLIALACCAAVVLANNYDDQHVGPTPTARLLALQRTVTKVQVVTV